MSSVQEPAARWRLEINLDDSGRQRTVWLDFADRAALERQLMLQLGRRDRYTPHRLLEFTNEAGETLAVVASAYTGHTIAEYSGSGSAKYSA